jgi:hypothetical protein
MLSFNKSWNMKVHEIELFNNYIILKNIIRHFYYIFNVFTKFRVPKLNFDPVCYTLFSFSI